MLAPISAADRVSVVVVRVMVKAPVAPVSVRDPVRVVVGRVKAADLATRVGRIGVGVGRVTAMVPVVPATAVAMAPLADLVPVPAPWVLVMVRVSPVMAVTLLPMVDRVQVPAPWVPVTARVTRAMANPDTRNPVDDGA